MLIMIPSVCQTIENVEYILNILLLNKSSPWKCREMYVNKVFTLHLLAISQLHKTYRIKASICFLESYQV